MRWAVVAHPDDELIFAGGAILSHRTEPWTVVVATQSLGTPRAAESLQARDALRAHGVEADYLFLGHADEQFHETGGIDPSALARQLAELGVRPGERVYTHGAPGEYGHNGHKAVHRGVAEALGPVAAVSAFSGGGELIERIVDPEPLALKAKLFNEAYPSQKGVWRGLAQTMLEVIREERHFALSPADAVLAGATNPLRPYRSMPPGAPDEGALPAAIAEQIARLKGEPNDALVIGLGGLDPATLRPKVSGRIDVVDAARDMPPDGRADVQLVATDLLQWEPGDRTYDLIVSAGVLQRTGDFDAFFRRVAGLLRTGGQMILAHEPLIEGHPDYGRRHLVLEAPLYRRPTQAVIDLARRSGLKFLSVKDLVAGRRQGEPVIHQILRFERR